MEAKKLLKKHMDLNIPNGIHLSEKQLEQAKYDASIGAIEEAIAYVPEPVIPSFNERESLVNEIKRIVNKVGNFSVRYGAIAEENTIFISQEGSISTQVFAFNDDNVDCDVYDGEEEIDVANYLYAELSLDVLRDIQYLAEIVEVDFEKTEKRIN